MSPWISAGNAVCEIPDVLSLLQVSTQLSHGGPSSSSNAGGAEEGSNALHWPLASFVGRTKGHAEEVESWRLRQYQLIRHRKGGTQMCGLAAANMQGALAAQSGLPVPLVDVRDGWYASRYDSPEPVCYAHVARNPFEMVVSGYLFNMAESELAWKEAKLGSPFTNTSTQVRALAELFNSSRSGPLSAWLPEANASETYAEYLKRVDLDTGLLAEFIVAFNSSLAPMRLAEDFTQSQHCSINVCLGDFFENCGATWHRVLQAWQIPERPYDAMLGAATKSCPGVAKERHNELASEAHSSARQMENMHLRHAPEHVMVNRLKELDRLRLNGRLAALEDHVKCPVSGKYKEPA